MTKLHLIESMGDNLYFNPETLELIDVRNNVSESNIAKLDSSKEKAQPIRHIKSIEVQRSNVIDRITLCVSNDCNLRCKYCYAHGGDYGAGRKLMDTGTAVDFVNFCFREFDKINQILFFGGEPLLNWRIIEVVCSSFVKVCNQKKIPLPKFSLITNGTILNEDILQLIKRYISFITISIDGIKIVNDSNRVFQNGSGTYDKISHFINKVKEINPLYIGFEATYTRTHLQLGLTRHSVKSFLQSEFGINGIVVDEDSLGIQQMINNIHNIGKLDIIESDFDCLPMDFWVILKSIATKKEHRFCGILYDRFTVTVDGSIIGCQMLINRGQNVISNIYSKGVYDIIKKHTPEFKKSQECMNCWCNPLCGGCCIGKFLEDCNGKISNIPNRNVCQLTAKYIEAILILIYKIRSDNELWPKLIKKCQNKY